MDRVTNIAWRTTGDATLGGELPFSWSYRDGSDLKSSLSYPNGLSASWNYDANNQLLQVCNAFPTNIISQYAYTYDAGGRRISCGKTGSAFVQNDTIAYAYNNRCELTNAVASVDSDYRYSYAFDEIGNRETSSERGTNFTYAANNLNQYTTVGHGLRVAPQEEFVPQYDLDGNQTLVKTATGVWSVTYNGENRPVRWTQGDTVITMSFDRMGRRVTKNDRRFVYNGYLQIANFHSTTTTFDYNYFVWDPTEPVATHPLAWNRSALGTQHSTLFYTHDGNKNVSEVVASNNNVTAHYEYAPFGALTVSRGTSAAANPWRFSSEYAEDDTATVYYNYRHYEPVTGRWMCRDPIEEKFEVNAYDAVRNHVCSDVDLLGLRTNSLDSDHATCNNAVDDAWKDPKIKSVLKEIKVLKNKLPSSDRSCDVNFACRCCGNYFSREGGAFYDDTHFIKICEDGYLEMKRNGTLEREVKRVLHHELLHALQRCKGAETSTCNDSICREINAYYNSNLFKTVDEAEKRKSVLEGVLGDEEYDGSSVGPCMTLLNLHKGVSRSHAKKYIKDRFDSLYEECKNKKTW